jgi:hypothetical protein
MSRSAAACSVLAPEANVGALWDPTTKGLLVRLTCSRGVQ